MEPSRTQTVRLDTMSSTWRALTCGFSLMALSVFGLIGIFGPQMITVINPVHDLGTDIPLTSSVLSSRPPNYCTRDVHDNIFSEPLPNCWNHYFSFHNPRSNYFKLEVSAKRNNLTAPFKELKNDILMYIELYGYRGNDAEPELIDANNVTREIACVGANQECQRTVVFTAAHIIYSKYWFMMRLPEPEKAQFLDTFTVFFAYENFEYASLELTVKYAFLTATVLIFATYWWYKCSKTRPALKGLARLSPCKRLFPYTTMEQKWVTALLIGVIGFCYPFSFVDYVFDDSARRVFEVVGVICQFTFVCTLLMFWLVSFDSLVVEPPYTFKNFYMGKFFFVMLFWIVGVSLYAWITVHAINEPLYNWTADTPRFHFMEAFLAIFGITYLVWISALVLRGFVELKNLNSGARFLYIEHLWRLVATVIGIVFGMIFDFDVDNSMRLLFFHAMFVFYVWELIWLYTPMPSNEEEDSMLDAIGVVPPGKQFTDLRVDTGHNGDTSKCVIPMSNMSQQRGNDSIVDPNSIMDLSLNDV